jgi:hypothetical protein
MQINAEDLLKVEGDNFDGTMTETEMTYLSAMEQVKMISKNLVAAEQAFALVRDRIRNLISRYESMLLKIEAGSYGGGAASSIVTYESSHYSEYDLRDHMKEERTWARRAMRAEIRAEIAAREASLAKQHARMMQQEKMREIDALKKKLDELQSENSVASADKEKLAFVTAMAQRNKNPNASQVSSHISQEKLVGVKQRFRDRMAEKKRRTVLLPIQGRAPLYPTNHSRRVTSSLEVQAERELIWSAGEEMFQQMVFYERSLEAVNITRMM